MPSMEQMDEQIYNALKSNFETLMLRMVKRVQEGNEEWKGDYDILMSVFNNTCDGSKELQQELRQLKPN